MISFRKRTPLVTTESTVLAIMDTLVSKNKMDLDTAGMVISTVFVSNKDLMVHPFGKFMVIKTSVSFGLLNLISMRQIMGNRNPATALATEWDALTIDRVVLIAKTVPNGAIYVSITNARPV